MLRLLRSTVRMNICEIVKKEIETRASSAVTSNYKSLATVCVMSA